MTLLAIVLLSVIRPALRGGRDALPRHAHHAPLRAAGARGPVFCVSYADPRDVEVCHEIGESVMLDNGAFTFWRKGGAVDWDGYYDWCGRWLEHWTTWAVIPDVIDGTEEPRTTG
jgi:hypothetical protein